VVQWERPNRRDAVIHLVLGLLIVTVALGCWWLYRVCRERTQNNNHSTNPVDSADDQEAKNMATPEDEPPKSPTAV
jgi:cytoskeletal protein RodZ